METKNDSTQKMDTLSECLNKAIEDGYVQNFKVQAGRLTTEDEKSFYTPNDVAIPNFFRFEGYSDPQDNAILYLVETIDGTMGTLIDSYGAEADASLANFIREVQDIQKKDKKMTNG